MPKPISKTNHHVIIFTLLLFVMTLVTSVNVYADPMGDGRMFENDSPNPEVDPLHVETVDIRGPDGAANVPPSAPQTLDQAIASSQCSERASTARSACMTPGTGGMEGGNAMMYTMLMNQLVSSAAQIASLGKNMAAQCKMQADISKVMTAINGVKGTACMTTINRCDNACGQDIVNAQNKAKHYDAQAKLTNPPNAQALQMAEDERQKVPKFEKLQGKCESYSTQVAAMMMGAMQQMGNFAVNKQCASDLAAFSTAGPTYTPIAMPTIGDCSDPNNQSLTCYCQKDANKASPMCAGFSGGNPTAGNGGTTTAPNGSTTTTPYASVTDPTDGGDTTDPFAALNGNKAGGAGGGPGDGGSGAPGGGGLSALGSEGGGSGGGGDPRSAITGTSGGTGSGLGSPGGGGGGGGGLARNNGGAGKGDGFFDKFNLKKFLPGSKFKARGIAGMSVKSVDGITGPMGPSIWEKATRQYQEQIQKQNVILDK